MISTAADLERLPASLLRGRIVPPGPWPEEMSTAPAHIEGAVHGAGLQRFAYGGRVYRLRSGSRYGHGAELAGTRDLSRALVHSVAATDATGEETDPVAARSRRPGARDRVQAVITGYGAGPRQVNTSE
ncbi:hypothetical protein AB0D38_28990 [Streptomyces sp. NPDC048279]|uniref:hypothetical protein n=1 Tax=Streptomyces sp. NPDC048279 TaxID=3154714 RepID=UPI00343E9BF8